MPSLRFPIIATARATIPFASLLLITCSLNNNVFPPTVKGVLDTTLEDASCNPETWVGGSYGGLVSGVLTLLVANCPNQPGYRCSVRDTDGTDTVYGFSECDATRLAPWECSACLTVARQTTDYMCPYAVGATVELVDCSMRYENYQFV